MHSFLEKAIKSINLFFSGKPCPPLKIIILDECDSMTSPAQVSVSCFISSAVDWAQTLRAGGVASNDGETRQDDSLLPHLQLRQSHYRTNHVALRQVPLQASRRRRPQIEAAPHRHSRECQHWWRSKSNVFSRHVINSLFERVVRVVFRRSKRSWRRPKETCAKRSPSCKAARDFTRKTTPHWRSRTCVKSLASYLMTSSCRLSMYVGRTRTRKCSDLLTLVKPFFIYSVKFLSSTCVLDVVTSRTF